MNIFTNIPCRSILIHVANLCYSKVQKKFCDLSFFGLKMIKKIELPYYPVYKCTAPFFGFRLENGVFLLKKCPFSTF